MTTVLLVATLSSARARRPSCRAQELLTGDAEFMQPAARRNEVLAWVRGGLRDFSISRAAVEWGIRIPRDTSQTVYVWCVPG